jgi:hypothetical protein
MERARINGTELEYEVAGRGEPVVFIHGALIAAHGLQMQNPRGMADALADFFQRHPL